MIQVKLLEIRDKEVSTHVMAIRPQSSSARQRHVLTKAGISPDTTSILLIDLKQSEMHADSNEWVDKRMRVAHQCIEDYFYELVDGQILVVPQILGENIPLRTEPKLPEERPRL